MLFVRFHYLLVLPQTQTRAGRPSTAASAVFRYGALMSSAHISFVPKLRLVDTLSTELRQRESATAYIHRDFHAQRACMHAYTRRACCGLLEPLPLCLRVGGRGAGGGRGRRRSLNKKQLLTCQCNTCNTCASVYMYICICVCICMCVHIYIYIYIYICLR